MTCIEMWKKMHQGSLFTEQEIMDNECPSRFGIMVDPLECGDINYKCEECWNRQVPGTESEKPVDITDAKLRVFAAVICDAFEDLLEQHDITIPDLEREGNEDEARLYGLAYENLENRVVDILKKMVTST